MEDDLLRGVLRRPIVVAPMAGGPTTVGLVVAAAEAGALGFLAAGYKTAAAVKAEMDAVRASTAEAFGVNVFVPGVSTSAPRDITRYIKSLAPDFERVGAEPGEAVWDDDEWADKVRVLLEEAPPVVSFTFGCPSPDIVSALREGGSVVVITVTEVAEGARRAAKGGADALCVQGLEAGAHRGTFTNDQTSGDGRGLVSLVGEVARETDLPQLAAGGIMQATEVAAVLDAGAVAVQCGTAFLRCPESGAHPAHKAALGDDRFTATALTRSFSGRPARGLVNDFMRRHPDAPPAYPEINNATRPLRAAAQGVDDVDRMNLWAGTGFKAALPRAAGEIIERLSSR